MWPLVRVVGRRLAVARGPGADRADRTVGFDGNVAPFRRLVRWMSLFSALSLCMHVGELIDWVGGQQRLS